MCIRIINYNSNSCGSGVPQPISNVPVNYSDSPTKADYALQKFARENQTSFPEAAFAAMQNF